MAVDQARTREQQIIQKWLSRLTEQKRHAFPAYGGKIDAASERGVYVIYSPQGHVLHVGSTPWAKGGVAQRLRDHLAGRSSFVVKTFDGDGTKLRKRYMFQYLVIEDDRQRALVEALSIGQLCPKHIGHGRNRSAK